MVKPSSDKVFIAKQHVNMMMMLNHRNMQISVLEINTESIITPLNKLPYLTDSRHLKCRYVHLVIKSLHMECGLSTTSIPMNHKTFDHKSQYHR